VLALLSLASLPLEAAENPQSQFEITPFLGLRAGGDFKLDNARQRIDLDGSSSLALALNLRIDESSQYELFYARQSSNLERSALLSNADIDIDYLHIGGTAALSDEYRVIPYVAGGLGATHFHPDPAQANDKTRFSISLAAGLRVPVSKRFSFRFEGRGYLTLIDTDTAFFCRSDENGALCRLRGSGSTFIQYELLAGAAFAF
jgi:opacity protein-like surface antigen